jgi:hypothetical protein
MARTVGVFSADGPSASKMKPEFASYTVARALPKDGLHPRLAATVWLAFMRGDYDVAVFQAMKAVEVSVRVARWSRK